MEGDMSETYVALLRGINVGRAKRVPMADLRGLLEGLGFRDVRTLLNSGNAVFSAPKSASAALVARIEEGLTRRLRVTANVTVVSVSELQAAVDALPLATEGRNPSRLMVGFFRTPADERRIDDVVRQKWTPDEVAKGPRVVYVWCPDSILESRAFEAIGRAAGDAITTRNWSTVTKLLALATRR
jgi:uncharacterized protein (DUF1697 family)